MGKTIVRHRKARSWRDLVQFYLANSHRLQRWIFRGEGAGPSTLRSKLELACKHFGVTNLWRAEESLLREFQRHYFKLVATPPLKSDTAEWLSVIRHYGGPTRLLDWTYSFWMAVYFAVARARPRQLRILWMVDHDALHDAAKVTMDTWLMEYLQDPHSDEKKPEFIDAILNRGLDRGVWGVNPFRLNERLAVQQGMFLAATNLDFPFRSNLLATAHLVDHPTIEILPLHLEDTAALTEALSELRSMGITQRTLFGGIDGLAQGLWDLLANPRILRKDGFSC